VLFIKPTLPEYLGSSVKYKAQIPVLISTTISQTSRVYIDSRQGIILGTTEGTSGLKLEQKMRGEAWW
jgi:hypothetical protein